MPASGMKTSATSNGAAAATTVTAVARISDGSVDAIAGRWIDLVEEELGMLPREEKPWIRELSGQVVAFCRTADAAPDVLFAWSL